MDCGIIERQLDASVTEPEMSDGSADTVTILTTKGGLYATKRLRLTGSGWLTTDYSNAKHFSLEERQVVSIFGLSALLDELEGRPYSFVVMGEPIGGIDRARVRRRSRTVQEKDGAISEATLRARARYWVPLDLDSLPMPPGGVDPLTDPEAAVRHVVSMLPIEFGGVTVRWNYTSSMTFKPGLRMRLWFWASRPISGEELKRWLGERVPSEGKAEGASESVWPVDPALFNPAQPIYTATPIFSGGSDPVPTRSGLLIGDRHVVVPPTIGMPEPPPRGGKGGRRKGTAGGTPGTAKTAAGSAACQPCGVGYECHRSMIGDHVGGGGFHGPIKSAVASWIARHGSRADTDWLRADLERAIRQAERNPAKHPADYVEVRVRDLDGMIDAILGRQRMREAREAEEAAVPAHPPTFADGGVSLAEGERLVGEAVSRFMAACAAREAVPEALRGPPPRMAVIATLGVGKTKVVADAIGALAAGTAVNVLSPDHALGRELTARLAAAAPGHAVVQILGREAVDADGVPMCSQREQVAAWAALGGSVQGAFCRRETDDGTVEECEHFAACRYQAQRADDSPAVRVGSHAHLGLPQEVNSIRLDALTVVDESPVDTLVRVGSAVKLDDVWRAEGRQVVTRRPSAHVEDNADFNDWSLMLREVLEQPDPTPAMLREAGLDAGRCKRMAGWWFDPARMGEEVTPAMPTARKEEIIKGRMQTARIALRMARLWKLLEELLALPAGDDLGELRCLRVRKNTVELAYSKEAKIGGPLLILDGTADDEILRRFWPDIEIVRIRVRPEHYHLIQVTDRAVSMAMLADGDPSEAARAAGHRAEVARLAEGEAARFGAAGGTKVAVFTFKSAAEAIRRDHGHLPDLGVECGFPRPDGKSAGHFGAVRGLDRWRDVPTAIVAGRLRPSPGDVERQARAIFWKDVRPMEYLPAGENLPTVTEYLAMAGGGSVAVEAESHPDPLVRRVLDQICRADLEQTVHRLRLVRRTADNPARVLLLTNVVLPLAVHETVTWDGIMGRTDPLAMLLARGVFPEGWPARAKVLADFFGGADHPCDAARQWFRRREEALLLAAKMVGERWTAYLCRAVGARARETVQVDGRHADPRAAVEAFLGPLDVFVPAAGRDSEAASRGGP